MHNLGEIAEEIKKYFKLDSITVLRSDINLGVFFTAKQGNDTIKIRWSINTRVSTKKDGRWIFANLIIDNK